MARRAFRVTYIVGGDQLLGNTTYHGDSTADALAYGESLFDELEDGIVEVFELPQAYTVPDDKVLGEWAEAQSTSPEVVEAMRVPGVLDA